MGQGEEIAGSKSKAQEGGYTGIKDPGKERLVKRTKNEDVIKAEQAGAKTYKTNQSPEGGIKSRTDQLFEIAPSEGQL